MTGLSASRGNVAEKDAQGSLAHLGYAFGRQSVAERCQCVIVEAFAQPLIKMNPQEARRVFSNSRQDSSTMRAPDSCVFRVPQLKL